MCHEAADATQTSHDKTNTKDFLTTTEYVI